MKNVSTKYTVANEARMMRSQHVGALLIVEGPSDKTAYGNLVNDDACKIVIAHGKTNALGAVDILENENFQGVLGIVDADFSHLDGTLPSSKNVLATDLHDLECMVLATPAFTKVVNAFISAASPTRLESFEEQHGEIRMVLLTQAMTVGYLRWHSSQRGLGLRFKGLSFGKFTDQKSLWIDEAELITEVKNHSQKHGIEDSALKADANSLRDPSHDPWQVACGHDILGILSFALQRTIATNRSLNVRHEVMVRSLCLAYEAEHFRKTHLYVAILNWEAEHPSYKVLPAHNKR